MLSVRKEPLEEFYVGRNRYIIPFFQRSYVWDEEDWQVLWDDIAEMYEDDKQNEHFCGSVIIQHSGKAVGNSGEFDLVDGQQRFTTFSILLKGLAEACDNQKEKYIKENIEKSLYFNDDDGERCLRIEHSKIDKKYYQEILNNSGGYEELSLKNLKEAPHKLVKCYVFFREKINELEIDDIERKKDLRDLILQKMPIVSMILDKDDDPQEIFDTVNSLGVRLTLAELVKNYLFGKPDIRDKYDEHWESVFEGDEQTIDFWKKPKLSGRVYRTNLELLLYSFLVISNKTKKSIKLETLFNEYKKWWNGLGGLEKKISALKELGEYAEVYRKFSLNNLQSIKTTEYDKRLFRVLDALSVTTPYPLILYYLKNQAKKDELEKRNKFFWALESYLMRRCVCKLSTNSYNNLFLEILQDFANGKTTLSEALLKQKGNSRRLPEDEELKSAFISNIFPSQISRGVLYSIALKQFNNKSDVHSLLEKYTLEHVMPQKWETNWEGADSMSEKQKEKRNYLLKTLGNLTLVSPDMNSHLSNKAWDIKKKALEEHSQLKITTKYLKGKWDEKKMEGRAEELYEVAKDVWPRLS